MLVMETKQRRGYRLLHLVLAHAWQQADGLLQLFFTNKQMSEHDSDEEGEEEGVEDRRQAAGAGPSATAEQALDGEGELSACAAKKVISAAQLARNRAEFQQVGSLRWLR